MQKSKKQTFACKFRQSQRRPLAKIHANFLKQNFCMYFSCPPEHSHRDICMQKSKKQTFACKFRQSQRRPLAKMHANFQILRACMLSMFAPSAKGWPRALHSPRSQLQSERAGIGKHHEPELGANGQTKPILTTVLAPRQ